MKVEEILLSFKYYFDIDSMSKRGHNKSLEFFKGFESNNMLRINVWKKSKNDWMIFNN